VQPIVALLNKHKFKVQNGVAEDGSRVCVCVACWELKSAIEEQRRGRLEYGGQSIKPWLEQFKETGNILYNNDAGRPSIDTATGGSVREAFQRSSGYHPTAGLEENFKFLEQPWRQFSIAST